MNAGERALVHVVAGIVLNGEGDYLLSSRPEGKPYAGYWEFAGGKVEAGESELAALQREFEEELGIRIRSARPWLTKIHDYEHARVYLRFFRVAADEWSGDIQAKEGQKWSWQKAGDFTVSPMLPANGPLLEALAVPQHLHGSPQQGYRGENRSGEYRILPLDDGGAQAADNAYRLCRPSENTGSEAARVWLYWENGVLGEAGLPQAAGIVWRIDDAAAAETALERIRQGVAVPLLIDSTAALNRQFGGAWLAAGAHAVCING